MVGGRAIGRKLTNLVSLLNGGEAVCRALYVVSIFVRMVDQGEPPKRFLDQAVDQSLRIPLFLAFGQSKRPQIVDAP